MLPDFIIIGAMKGGTTSLFNYIASHPGIIPSSIKETDFFASDKKFKKGIDWYKNLFPGKGEYAFEASPNYTKRHKFPGVPERMHTVLPNTKLIYVLRDPLERLISHYIHSYSHGLESRPFHDVIKSPENNYIQTSKYYFQLSAFLAHYSENQLLIIESENLQKNPEVTLSKVFAFLQIPPDYDKSLLEMRFHRSNKKKAPSALERAIRKKTNNRYLLGGIRKITTPFLKQVERPTLSPNDKEMLVEAIAPDIEKLRQFTGSSFSEWSL